MKEFKTKRARYVLLLDHEDSKGNKLLNWDAYVAHMKVDGIWGGSLEALALAESYDVKLLVLAQSTAIPSVAYNVEGSHTMVAWYTGIHFELVLPKPGKAIPADALSITRQPNTFAGSRGGSDPPQAILLPIVEDRLTLRMLTLDGYTINICVKFNERIDTVKSKFHTRLHQFQFAGTLDYNAWK